MDRPLRLLPLLLLLFVLAPVALLPIACGDGDEGSGGSAAPSTAQKGSIILATTTSTQDSGLLDELVPAFTRAEGYQVKTIAVGSGQAIELGGRGEADVVLAHSPDAEKALLADGKASARLVVMHNDFIVVGPADDPAKIKGLAPTEAFAAIAKSKSPFISRGDESGTNTFELKLWKQAGIEPKGSWYQRSGQGMGQTLGIAAEKDAYTLADRGTYLTQPRGLKILVEGDPTLLNVYHVMPIASSAGPRVNAAGGKAFADWIVSPPAQKLIGAFGVKKYGEPLFTPDAGKTDAEVKQAA